MPLTTILRLVLFAIQASLIVAQTDSGSLSTRKLKSIQQYQARRFDAVRSTIADTQKNCVAFSRVNHTSALVDCSMIFRDYESLTKSLISHVRIGMTQAVAIDDCAKFVAESHKAISVSDKTSRKSAELSSCMLHEVISSNFRAHIKEMERGALRDLELFLQTIGYHETVYSCLNPWSDDIRVEKELVQTVEAVRWCIRQVERAADAREAFLQVLIEAGHVHKAFGKQSADTEGDWDPEEGDINLDGQGVSEAGCSQRQLRSMQKYLKDARAILGL